MKVYLASGWFSEGQMEQLVRLETLLESYEFLEVISPRKVFNCPPGADQETQKKTFEGNVTHIKSSDFVLVNTSYRDIGTIWEAGASYAYGTPIVYFCEGLPEGAQFNLMLAKSGIKVTTSISELKDYLNRVEANGGVLLNEPYTALIE